MGNTNKKISYHILRKNDTSFLFYWPQAHLGEICKNKKIAMKTFNKFIKQDKTGSYRLISINNKTGAQTIILEYNNNNNII